MTLATVAVTDKMRVDLNLSSDKAETIKKGQPAKIIVPLRTGDITVLGQVESVALSADPTTGLFAVRVVFDNPNDVLVPGNVTRVQILVYSVPDSLIIPKPAVVSEADKRYVFVVDKKNIAEKRMITVGWEGDEDVEVIAGINVGDRVVTKGQNKLTDGRARQGRRPGEIA